MVCYCMLQRLFVKQIILCNNGNCIDRIWDLDHIQVITSNCKERGKMYIYSVMLNR